MGDTRSADLFRDLFDKLAEQPDGRNREVARWLWQRSQRLDFAPSEGISGEAARALLPEVCPSCWEDDYEHDERDCEIPRADRPTPEARDS